MAARYIFRMDDICPSMKWINFNRIMEIFSRYHVVPLLGVVPENIDPFLNVDEAKPEFWQLMRDMVKDQRVEIAQHGTYHNYVSNGKGLLAEEFGFPPRSEFVGLNYEDQFDKLRKGRTILTGHGIETSVFMAPSHSYDEITLRALHALKFEAVTDGVARFPYREHGLIFVPQIHWAPEIVNGGISTICLHSNEMNEKQIIRISEFLEGNHTKVIRFSEALQEIRPYSSAFASYWKFKHMLLNKTLFPVLVKIRNKIFRR